MKFQPKTYSSKTELTKALKNLVGKIGKTTVILDWHEYKEDSTTKLYRKLLKVIFGQQAITSFKDTVILIPTLDAGWGHRIEAYGFARDIATTLKCYALFYYPTEYGNKQELFFYNLKYSVVNAVHHGNPIEEVLMNIDKNIPFSDKIKLALLRFFMVPVFKVTYEKDNLNSESLFSKLVQPILSTNRFIISIFARIITDTEIFLTESFFYKSILKFIYGLNAKAVFTTHSYNIRAQQTFPIPAISHIPDPGYGPVRSEGLIEDIHLIEPFAGYADSNIAYTLPSYAIQDILKGVYRVKGKTYITGTVNSTITPQELEKKWAHEFRNILLSSNGNGSNIEYLAELTQDFINQSKDISEIKYNILFFTGDHNDKKCRPILNIMKNLPVRLKSHIKLYRTKSKWETAVKKIELIKESHIELRSMGEQIIDVAMGCVPVGTKTNPVNEVRNTLWCIENTTGLAFPYKENYEFWKLLLHLNDKTLGFANKYNNLFDYFDYIFYSDKKIAQTIINSGFKRYTSDANFYNIAFLIQQIEKIQSFSDKCDTAKQEILEYRTKIA
jgi:hypothetical protein